MNKTSIKLQQPKDLTKNLGHDYGKRREERVHKLPKEKRAKDSLRKQLMDY